MMLFGAFMVLTSLYHMRMLPTGSASTRVSTIKETSERFGKVVKDFFQKKYIWWGISFLILYQFASGQGIKIFPLFLRAPRARGGLGLPLEEIGVIYGFFPPIAFILGSILAGYFTARRGLKKSLLALCVFFNVPFAAYAFLAITQPINTVIIGIACAVEYFGYGVGFVGMILFIMQQIAPGKYKTAHYAFGAAILVFGTNLFSMFSGYLSDFLGYREFFIWVLIATIPSFLISWLVPFKDIEMDLAEAPKQAQQAEK
jgi:PAT family beta-lactamase induction signal transducer AmpG